MYACVGHILAPQEFAQRFDGFSIGSNDLTQLILGVDRDSEELSDLFDERNQAVKTAIAQVNEKAHAAGCKVTLKLDFEPLSRLLGPALALGMQGLADRMVDDFVREADRAGRAG